MKILRRCLTFDDVNSCSIEMIKPLIVNVPSQLTGKEKYIENTKTKGLNRDKELWSISRNVYCRRHELCYLLN